MLDNPQAHALDFAPPPAGAWLQLDGRGRLSSASNAAARIFGHSGRSTLIDARHDVDTLFSNHSFFETLAQADGDAAAPEGLWLARRADGTTAVVVVRLMRRNGGWHCRLEPDFEVQRLQRALHEERARFAALADISSNGISMSDGERLVYVNAAAARLLGYERTELLGRPCAQTVSPECRERVEALGDRLACGDPPVLTTAELLMKDGVGRKNVSVSISKIEFDGRPLYLGVLYDITDYCRREKALKDYARRVRQMSQQVLEIQENERRNLARELHDEIGQQLTLLKLSLARVAEPGENTAVDEALNAVSTLMRQVRELSLDLRPAMLDDLGLGATLRWYIGRIAKLAPLEVRLDVDPEFPRLEPDLETLFFRIAQEAVTNVIRHARARHLRVKLRCRGKNVELRVADDGRGFDVDAAHRAALRGSSAGLLGMQERAVLKGAELALDSEPGIGTRLRLVIPRMPAGTR